METLFPTSWKNILLLLKILFFILWFAIILTHEASYKRCFGNCSPSPPKSHQNIYCTPLRYIGAEVSTNNSFWNWDVKYQKEPTHLDSSLQLLFLKRMAQKAVIAEIPKTNESLMSNYGCNRQLVIFFFSLPLRSIISMRHFIQMMHFSLSKATVKCETKTCKLICNIAKKRVGKAMLRALPPTFKNLKSGFWVAWLGTLSNHDDYGSENVAKKMNLSSFKLNRVYLDPLKFQMPETFPGVKFLMILFRFKKRKQNSSSYVHALHKTSN